MEAETHTHNTGDPPYTHTHVDPDCTHRWKTCPVHGAPEDALPPFRTMLTCVYGGAELKEGGWWNSGTSHEVTEKIVEKLAP